MTYMSCEAVTAGLVLTASSTPTLTRGTSCWPTTAASSFWTLG